MRAWIPVGIALALTFEAQAQDQVPCEKTWTFPVPFFQSLDWSPDGSKLVFSAVMESWDAGYSVYVIGADGTGLVRLSTDGQRDLYPVWSPDGSRIAFASTRDGNSEIYAMKADGSDVRRLTHNEAKDTYPDWSPDGSRIVFTSDRDGNYEIYVMHADGSAAQRLTNHPADDYNPAWSPDGARIVYEADRSGDGVDELYLVDPSGTKHDSLGVAGVFPTWSPDGSLVFATTGDLQRLDLESRKVAPVAASAIYGAVSPAGTRLAVARFHLDAACKDHHALVVTRADGSDPTVLLPRPSPKGR